MATQETKNQKLFGWGIGAAAILLFVVWFVGQSKKTMRQAEESEVLSQVAALATAEQTYHAEFQKYSDDFNVLGYSPEGKSKKGRLYLKFEDVPMDLQGRLSEGQRPFVAMNEFRILGVYKPDAKEVILFIKNHDSPVKREVPYVGAH